MSSFWDWVVHLSAHLESGIASLVASESEWIYPSIFGVSLFDAVIPIFPSESMVIGAASAGQSAIPGWLYIALLFVSAAGGAWCGDQTAYFVGTRINVRSIKFFRRRRVLATLDWAEHSLQHRGTLYIIAARFIPMGRVAVNLTAGAVRYPHRRFMAVDAVGTSLWAAWAILIGTVARSLFGGNVLLSIAAGVTGGLLLGVAVDKVMGLLGLSAPEMPDLAAEIEKKTEPASE
jgi:membrane protein DedA with SNARE-associated domain